MFLWEDVHSLKNAIRPWPPCQPRLLTAVQRLVPKELEFATDALDEDKFVLVNTLWYGGRDVTACFGVDDEAVEGSRIVVKLEGQAAGHDEARGLASCGGGGYTVHDQVYRR